jgi:nucleoside phosphorylase
MAAAKAMLDEIHKDLPKKANDHNAYTLGSINGHNIVIACLPSGVYGTNSAAVVATQMLSSFQSIRIGLMVGIGGGVPKEGSDIRLGDIVVSKPTGSFGGVVQYDYGKTVEEGRFVRTGSLNKPPIALLTAVAKLEAEHMMAPSKVSDYLSAMTARYPAMTPRFTYRGKDIDRLFNAKYDHAGSNATCENCDKTKLVDRPVRSQTDPAIHYGVISSGNQVIRHGLTRDRLGKEHGILTFETEAAGLMDTFPCLVIRGICDYADSHKNKQWQEYSAAVAAAYAKELLSVIPTDEIVNTPTAVEATAEAG